MTVHVSTGARELAGSGRSELHSGSRVLPHPACRSPTGPAPTPRSQTEPGPARGWCARPADGTRGGLLRGQKSRTIFPPRPRHVPAAERSHAAQRPTQLSAAVGSERRPRQLFPAVATRASPLRAVPSPGTSREGKRRRLSAAVCQQLNVFSFICVLFGAGFLFLVSIWYHVVLSLLSEGCV